LAGTSFLRNIEKGQSKITVDAGEHVGAYPILEYLALTDLATTLKLSYFTFLTPFFFSLLPTQQSQHPSSLHCPVGMGHLHKL
jgi:hypothetical protein